MTAETSRSNKNFGSLNLLHVLFGTVVGAVSGFGLWMGIQINGVGWPAGRGWPLNSWALAIVLGAIAGVVGEILRQYFELRRRASLLEVSDHLGFELQTNVSELDLPPMRIFENRTRLANHMRGVDRDVVYDVFDLSTKSKSDDGANVSRTVILTELAELPEFRLTPQTGLGWLHAFSPLVVSFDPMAFQDASQRLIVERFNRSYVLEVDDTAIAPNPAPAEKDSGQPTRTVWEIREVAARDKFRLDLLAGVASRTGWSMESKGGYLALWREGQKWSGSQLIAHVAQAVTLHSELSKRVDSSPLVPPEPEGVRRRRAVLVATQIVGGISGVGGGFAMGFAVTAFLLFRRNVGQGFPFEMLLAFVGAAIGCVLGIGLGKAVGWLAPPMPPKAARSFDWIAACLAVGGFFAGFYGGGSVGIVVGNTLAKGNPPLQALICFGSLGVGILLMPVMMYMFGTWAFAERAPKKSRATDIA